MSDDPQRSVYGEASKAGPFSGHTKRHQSGDWRREAPSNGGLPDAAAGDAGALLVNKAKETARATAKALSSQASELAANIGDELTETAEQQKGRGADAMRSFAQVAKGAASELDGQSPTVARYVRSAAESVEGFSETIRSRDVGELLKTATETARAHPAAFFVGAVAAGFALSRFFKSSSKPSSAGGKAHGSVERTEPLSGSSDDSREAVLGMGGRT